MKRILALPLALILAACAAHPVAKHNPTAAPSPYVPCVDDAARQSARSRELAELAAADQAEREHFEKLTGTGLLAMAARDVTRRERVGAIFGEGCMKSKEDFAHAAIVFQHGDRPEHFLQAFLWAKRAVELGDASQKILVADAIDRYLVNTGHRQLFGTQASKQNADDPKGCYCLSQVEQSFPDARRKEQGGKNFAGIQKWLSSLNQGKDCPRVECATALKPSPAGTVPGYW